MPIFKISLGQGRPGKRWTGSQEFWSLFSPEGETLSRHLGGQLCEVDFAEHWSASGVSTRRLFLRRSLGARPDLEAALQVKTLHLVTGGVDAGLPRLCIDDIRRDVAAWNWSGRVGGFAVVDPMMVAHTPWWRRGVEYPEARPGYAWLRLHEGRDWAEDVLVQLDEHGGVHPRHLLPVWRRVNPTLSPPEREALRLRKEASRHLPPLEVPYVHEIVDVDEDY